jgi:hypothetical protein
MDAVGRVHAEHDGARCTGATRCTCAMLTPSAETIKKQYQARWGIPETAQRPPLKTLQCAAARLAIKEAKKRVALSKAVPRLRVISISFIRMIYFIRPTSHIHIPATSPSAPAPQTREHPPNPPPPSKRPNPCTSACPVRSPAPLPTYANPATPATPATREREREREKYMDRCRCMYVGYLQL